MNWKQLLTQNKYVMYVLVALSAFNFLYHISKHHWNAVFMFSIFSAIFWFFNKNLSLVLLGALFLTNLVMFYKQSANWLIEGMENKNTNDPELNDAIDTLNKSTTVKEAIQKMKDNKGNKTKPSNIETDGEVADPNNPDLNKDDGKNKKYDSHKVQGKKDKSSGSRIDYASTLEEAYANLDKVLGSDGMKNLSKDTTVLMKKQQELFESMKSMAPVLQNAQSMMSGLDLTKLGDMANMVSSGK